MLPGESQVLQWRVEGLLKGEPVALSDYPAYCAFARQVARRFRKYSGLPLVMDLHELVRAWSERGLKADVLTKVLSEVFGIGPVHVYQRSTDFKARPEARN